MSRASEFGNLYFDGGDTGPQSHPIEPKRHWWNGWLRLTSRGASDEEHASLTERELLRRSRLLSWILLGMFAVELILLVLDSSDTATLLSVSIALAGTVLATLLNRLGYVTAGGVLLVLLVIAAVMGAVSNSPGHILDTIYLPAYDLLAIPVIIATSVLPRISGFFVAVLDIGLICADYYLQPHGPDLIHQEQLNGALSMVARPIVLQVIVATVAFLWVRGAEEAIRRADRAEELAALEHAIADQRRQLEIGVQQILETHVRVANGDFTARAPMNQDNLLWQIAASLNNLLGRLQKSGQAEYQLRRTEDEVRRLVTAIDDARQGRRPIWPAPAGTVADLLIERVVGTNRPSAPRGMEQAESPRMPYDGARPSLVFPQLSQSFAPPPVAPDPFAPPPVTPDPFAPQTAAPDPFVPQAPVQEPTYNSPPESATAVIFPTIPQSGFNTFRPPRIQPLGDEAASPEPEQPTLPDTRPSVAAAPRDLGVRSPRPMPPETTEGSQQAAAETARSDERWPDLLHEMAAERDQPAGTTLPPNTPSIPPHNPYADLWEMHVNQ